MLKARLELGLATITGVLTVVTFFWPTWLESLTGLQPDEGRGETEWGLVLLLAAITLVMALLSRRDYARVRRQEASEGS